MELTSGRMFSEYGSSMDAVLADKAKDIEPWLVPGLVVDRGCGTGALMRYLAKKDWKVVGIELSASLSKENHGVVMADILDPVFADGFASNVILSSVLHEVYSYKGYSLYPVMACLQNCARELRKGGRIIIRDIWSPKYMKDEMLELVMDEPTAKKLDYFIDNAACQPARSSIDWRGPAGNGKTIVRLKTKDAVEFLSKKDYNQHWDLELKEVYTSVPMSEIRLMANALGLRVAEARPIRNDWIIRNRWHDGVEFDDSRLFTNQLVVLEKT